MRGIKDAAFTPSKTQHSRHYPAGLERRRDLCQAPGICGVRLHLQQLPCRAALHFPGWMLGPLAGASS